MVGFVSDKTNFILGTINKSLPACIFK